MNEQKLHRLFQTRLNEFLDFLDDLKIRHRFVIKLVIGDLSEFPKTRNLAYTNHVSKNHCDIVFAPKWYLSEANFDAVMRHELAHAFHFLYPNVFVHLRDYGLFFHKESEEIFADKCAELIFGERIYYDKDLIRTLTVCPISCRPMHLGW